MIGLIMTNYLAVFTKVKEEDIQYAVVVDDGSDLGDYVALAMKRYLDDPRTDRIEVRDSDDRIRGVAHPAKKG